MKSRTCLYCFLPLILTTTAYGQGIVIDDSFFSVSLDMTRMVDVYLPGGYDPDDSTNNYPVIYFLHGAGGDQNSYSFLIAILNSLIADNAIEPLIVVKPDGSIGPYLGSFYTNSELYGFFEDYIAYDLVDYIDSEYNTITSLDKRAVMGHSMGGYGSMKLALKHPDIFHAVAAHSGPLNLEANEDILAQVLEENGGSGPFHPSAGIFSLLVFTAAGAFSPNLNNPPYYVDFPIDNDGNIIDSTWAKWVLHNPAHLATQYSADDSLAIYFDCGMQDELFIFPMNTTFADSLDSLDLPYEFQPYEGMHSNLLFERFPIALAFLDSVMSQGEGMLGDLNGDGELDIFDILLLIGLVLNGEYELLGDMNQDGSLDILDIIILINIVLGGGAN